MKNINYQNNIVKTKEQSSAVLYSRIITVLFLDYYSFILGLLRLYSPHFNLVLLRIYSCIVTI